MHEIRAGFLPEGRPIEERLTELEVGTLALTGGGATLERGPFVSRYSPYLEMTRTAGPIGRHPDALDSSIAKALREELFAAMEYGDAETRCVVHM